MHGHARYPDARAATRRYSRRIGRLLRALLVLATLALVFAPGEALVAPADATPHDATAAVLAPTGEESSLRSLRTTDLRLVPLLLLTAALVAALALAAAGVWVRHRPDARTAPRPPAPSSLSRRGPPALAA